MFEWQRWDIEVVGVTKLMLAVKVVIGSSASALRRSAPSSLLLEVASHLSLSRNFHHRCESHTTTTNYGHGSTAPGR